MALSAPVRSVGSYADKYTSRASLLLPGEVVPRPASNYDLIIRPSPSFINELSIAGSPLFAAPPVHVITSPGLTVSCTQPYDFKWFRLIISTAHSTLLPF